MRFLLAFISLIALAIWLWGDATSSDAAIYFTFVRRFFVLPFSFQTDVVSFGATAPLHVLWQAPLYALLGDPAWLVAVQGVNVVWLGLGGWLMARTTGASLAVAALWLWLNPLLFITAVQGYETPLAFAAVALSFWLMHTQRGELVLLLGGLFYLIRPEFALTTAVWAAYWTSQHPRQLPRHLALITLGLLPVFAYHAYLFHHTGDLLPSSVAVRATSGLGWLGRAHLTVASLWWPGLLIWGVGVMALFVRPPQWALPQVRLALAWGVVWGLPYLLWPPGSHFLRYLLPLTAVWLPLLHHAVPRRAVPLLLLVAILWQATLAYHTPWLPLPDLLLADVAAELNPTLTPAVGILAAESVGQYSLHGAVFGLYGGVGNHALVVPAQALPRYNLRYLIVSPGLVAEPWLTAPGTNWELLWRNEGTNERWTAVWVRRGE